MSEFCVSEPVEYGRGFRTPDTTGRPCGMRGPREALAGEEEAKEGKSGGGGRGLGRPGPARVPAPAAQPEPHFTKF